MSKNNKYPEQLNDAIETTRSQLVDEYSKAQADRTTALTARDAAAHDKWSAYKRMGSTEQVLTVASRIEELGARTQLLTRNLNLFAKGAQTDAEEAQAAMAAAAAAIKVAAQAMGTLTEGVHAIAAVAVPRDSVPTGAKDSTAIGAKESVEDVSSKAIAANGAMDIAMVAMDDLQEQSLACSIQAAQPLAGSVAQTFSVLGDQVGTLVTEATKARVTASQEVVSAISARNSTWSRYYATITPSERPQLVQKGLLTSFEEIDELANYSLKVTVANQPNEKVLMAGLLAEVRLPEDPDHLYEEPRFYAVSKLDAATFDFEREGIAAVKKYSGPAEAWAAKAARAARVARAAAAAAATAKTAASTAAQALKSELTATPTADLTAQASAAVKSAEKAGLKLVEDKSPNSSVRNAASPKPDKTTQTVKEPEEAKAEALMDADIATVTASFASAFALAKAAAAAVAAESATTAAVTKTAILAALALQAADAAKVAEKKAAAAANAAEDVATKEATAKAAAPLDLAAAVEAVKKAQTTLKQAADAAENADTAATTAAAARTKAAADALVVAAAAEAGAASTAQAVAGIKHAETTGAAVMKAAKKVASNLREAAAAAKEAAAATNEASAPVSTAAVPGTKCTYSARLEVDHKGNSISFGETYRVFMKQAPKTGVKGDGTVEMNTRYSLPSQPIFATFSFPHPSVPTIARLQCGSSPGSSDPFLVAFTLPIEAAPKDADYRMIVVPSKLWQAQLEDEEFLIGRASPADYVKLDFGKLAGAFAAAKACAPSMASDQDPPSPIVQEISDRFSADLKVLLPQLSECDHKSASDQAKEEVNKLINKLGLAPSKSTALVYYSPVQPGAAADTPHTTFGYYSDMCGDVIDLSHDAYWVAVLASAGADVEGACALVGHSDDLGTRPPHYLGSGPEEDSSAAPPPNSSKGA